MAVSSIADVVVAAAELHQALDISFQPHSAIASDPCSGDIIIVAVRELSATAVTAAAAFRSSAGAMNCNKGDTANGNAEDADGGDDDDEDEYGEVCVTSKLSSREINAILQVPHSAALQIASLALSRATNTGLWERGECQRATLKGVLRPDISQITGDAHLAFARHCHAEVLELCCAVL